MIGSKESMIHYETPPRKKFLGGFCVLMEVLTVGLTHINANRNESLS